MALFPSFQKLQNKAGSLLTGLLAPKPKVTQPPQVSAASIINRPQAYSLPKPIAPAPRPISPVAAPVTRPSTFSSIPTPPPAIQQTPPTYQSTPTAQATTQAPPTPTLPQLPPINTSGLEAAQRSILDFSRISPEEEATQRDYNNLIASRDLGVEQVRQQPIAMPFITGQAAGIERMANIKAQTLKDKLALDQAKRQAALESAKVGYEFERDKLSLQKEERDAFLSQQKPIEVGGNLVRFNPQTGSYDTVFSAPTDTKQTTDIQEYSFARNQGFNGSFVEYMQQKAMLNPSAYEVTTDPLTGQKSIFSKLTPNASNTGGGNNNPGNLKDPATGQFRTFNSQQEGYQALLQDLQGKLTGNTRTGLTPQSTLSQFVNVYAPASDNNNPTNYANFLAQKLGVNVNTPIGSLLPRINDLAQAITQFEGSSYQAPVDLSAAAYQQAISNPNVYDSLPAAQQTALVQYATANGLPIPTGTKGLSGEASKVKAIAETIVPEINQLKAEFQKNYKGALQGIVFGTNRALVKLVDNIADKIGRLRSGGAINKDEEARFKRQIASAMDIPFGNSKDAIAALDGILSEAQTVARGITPNATSTQSGGRIRVKLQNGQTGTIDPSEFDPRTMTKL